MFKFTCRYCGTVRYVRTLHEVREFCNRSCAAKAREICKAEKKAAKEEDNKTEYVIRLNECVFQPESIECTRRNCINCGWNPVVAKARLNAIMKRYETECAV